MATRFRPDHGGIGRLLVSAEFHDLVGDAAEAGRNYAEAIAPVGETGRYQRSFEVERGHVVNLAGSPRAAANLVNTVDYAAAVEWGARGSEGRHVLGRTVSVIEAF